MNILSLSEQETPPPVTVTEGEHVVGQFVGDPDGPTLIVFGGIHGNEQSGVFAIQRVSEVLQRGERDLKGRVFLLAGNTRALREGVRFIDADLNRHWTEESVDQNRPDAIISTKRAEDREQKEILTILDDIFSSAMDEVYALDLHSTSSKSEPFAMIGDTIRNREFAFKFPATILLGIEEQLDSTILEYVNNRGAVTLGFEAGQHTDAGAINNQEALIWLSLLNAEILPEDEALRSKYEDVLSASMGSQRLIEIRHRHAIVPSDNFRMEPGFVNFQPVRRRQLLARDRKGDIRAIESGLILMPLYQKQGSDGFFLGREISWFWLFLSKLLRKLNIGDYIRFLPGVRVSPTGANTLIVNTGIATIFPLQIFHLLGFRKRRWRDETLVVSRRKHDSVSPFVKNVRK